MTTRLRLVAQTSAIAITLGWAAAAAAQQAAPAPASAADAPVAKDIIVTGSSIRGVAPVGSNLSSVGHQQIENTAAQSIQQVLKAAPAVTGLQAPSQGGFGSADNSGTNAPTIHGLGGSASNSTLVLLNGHRLPTSGANHMLADPNIIPTIALERVEVLADGASSVYGSDAVAGVINFITRKNVNGFEADIQHGFASNYSTTAISALYGKTWDTGSFLAAYSFSDRSNLAASARSYARSTNFASLGGNNSNSSNKCTSPSITAGGATYFNTGTGYSTEPSGYGAQAGGGCSPTAWDLLPKEVRHTAFVEFRQDLSDRLHLVADFDYSNRTDTQNISRGTATATIYGLGATPPAGRSISPFFQSLGLYNAATGVTSTPTSYTLNYDADALYGPGATLVGSAEDFYGRLDLIYDVNDKWQVNLGGVIGRDHSQIHQQGTLNTADFALAVNGYTSAAINGVNQSTVQALTTANAFDPFGTGTSAATKAALIDSATYYSTEQTMRDAYLKVSGDLFKLPAGAVKIAVGGELLGYSIDQAHTALNGLGPSTADSTYLRLIYGRHVTSAYGELYVPLVHNGFVRDLSLNISGRYDHYSDFGSTVNPKLAANFEPVRGIKFRGNWSKSFVAPALTSIGANSSGQTGESAFTYTNGANSSTLPGGLAAVPLSLYPNAAGIPGAICTATTCNLTSVTGAVISGGNAGLKPQTGKDWSLGVDITPVQVPGLRVSATYWSDELRNGITAPQTVYAMTAASLSNLLTLYPNGATAAQLSAAQGALPQSGATTNAYFIYNYTQNNVLNLNVAGLDVEVMYHLATERAGNFTFDISGTRKTRFEQWFGADGTHFSVLGTAGFNTTFPSLKMEGRTNLAWSKGPFNAVVGVNYEGSYIWWGSGVVNPIVRNASGVPVGGGDKVSAFTTVDLHAAYTFEKLAGMHKANFYVDVTNLFDKNPPFVNTATVNGAVGYDSFSANPLGRVVSIGLRTKF